MAEEATAFESSVAAAENNASLEGQTSIEATIDLNALGGADSTCNNNENESKSGGGETSAATYEDEEKSLEFAGELTERGTKALKENEFEEAVECFSRALEIRLGFLKNYRVKHFGELAPECITSYYNYGRALLYKAQEEADPLGSMPKKDSESKQPAGKDASVKIAANEESSSAPSKVQEEGSSSHQKKATDDGDKEQEDDDEESDEEEDESDLDLSWKMLDLARAIADKHSGDTMDKVDVLSALGEVALEREDIDASLTDYQSALSILERLVEPDSMRIADLNFRICLCLETGSRAEEAVPYCEKAISVCKSRIQRLVAETKSSSDSAAISAVLETDEGVQQSSTGPLPEISVSDKEAEIVTLTELSVGLEMKLEDLQQLAVNPKWILQEILRMAATRDGGDEPKTTTSSSGLVNGNVGDLESPIVSTAQTNGGGVVGRGVKRVLRHRAPERNRLRRPRQIEQRGSDGNA